MNNPGRFRPGALVVVVTFLAGASVAFAQSAAPAKSAARIEATLRAVGAADFAFYQFQDPLLFPETALTVNPAVLSGFTHLFVDTVADIPYTRTDTTDTRADNSIGVKGGTLRGTDDLLAPSASFLAVFPLKATKGTAPVAGILGAAGLDYERIATRKINFDSVSESVAVTDLTWPLDVSVGGIYAAGQRGAGWGVSLTYDFGLDRHSFRETQQAVGSTIVTTWSDVLNPVDIYTNTLDLRGGVLVPLSTSASLGIAVGVEGGMRDASTAWKAIDVNGDGFADKLMTFNDWYVSSDAGGPPVPASKYDRLDRTWSLRALLSPEIRIALTDGLELFVDGTWRGFDMDYRTSFEHITYPSSTTDVSVARSALDTGLTSGEVLVGVALGETTDSLLKIGAGYRRIDRRYSQTGVDAAGNNTYSYLNPNHYPEASLGIQPANDAIVEAVTSIGLPPWSDTSDAVFLQGGMEFRAGSQVRFFGGLGITGSSRTRDYRVFNLDSRTAWNETIVLNGLAWDLRGTAGIVVELGKAGVFTFDCVGSGISGSASPGTETLPYDIVLGQDTANGTRDRAGSAPFSLRVHAGFSYTL